MKTLHSFRGTIAKLLVIAMILTSNSFFVCANGLNNTNDNQNNGYEETNENLEKGSESFDGDKEEMVDDHQDENDNKENGEKNDNEEKLDESAQVDETKSDETKSDETKTGEEEPVADETETKANDGELEPESDETETKISDEEAESDETKTETESSGVNETETESSGVNETETEETTVFESADDEEKAEEASPSEVETNVDDEANEGDIDSDNNASPSEITVVEKELLKETSSHDNSWIAVNNYEELEQFLIMYNKSKDANVYLSEDVTIDSNISFPTLANVTVCLHGHSITIPEGCKFSGWSNFNISFVNCDSENTANVNLNLDSDTVKKLSDQSGRFYFTNVNIVSNKTLHLENMKVTFDNCTFDITTDNDVLVNVVNSDVKIINADIDERDAGFVFDNSKVVLDKVSMRNNSVDTLIKAKNNTELTIQGKSVYEGNKNVYYIEDSKLYVLDGSGYAKDTLRKNANEEYKSRVVTKEGTKLLNPDSSGLDIVYKRNTGSYVLGVKNAEVEFDGVIIANEFTGDTNKMGAYVNLGTETSKLTLLNRAYVNQNTINIVATANDEFYGSKEKSDGTYDTLHRDATLSFYPKANGLTLLRDVIKKNESSNIFVARDYKINNEWDMAEEGFFYKACMIQDYTDDTYACKPLPYGLDVVACDVEDMAGGQQRGTFYLTQKKDRTVIIRFHLGEAKVPYVSWREDYDITDTLDFTYIPSKKSNSSYQANWMSDFDSVVPKWIDNTIPGEPYEYTFRGWSTTKDHLIVPSTSLTFGGGLIDNASTASIGFLENGAEDIIKDKYGKYDYYEVVDLYACWKGDLKITYVFKAEERALDVENPLKMEKWTEKRIVGRSHHPFTLPTYVEGEDYKYDHFNLIGWQRRSYTDEYDNFVDLLKSGVYDQGAEVTDELNDWYSDYDGKEVYYYAVFEGEPHDIYWYFESEGIKEIKETTLKENIIKEGDKKGFYKQGIKLGERYSKWTPVLDWSILNYSYTNFTLEDGVEFIGWTKQEIKKPLNDAELKDVVLVKDYVGGGYSTLGDSYYYPVLHYISQEASHEGNIVLSQSYIDLQSMLGSEATTTTDEGIETKASVTYELVTDIKLGSQIEIVGDVTIDLHGHRFELDAGAFFYGDGNITITDCKHSETDFRDRGYIYNSNGVIYKGTGKLKLQAMRLEGQVAHRFESINGAILDDVEFCEIDFNSALGDVLDQYNRLMQIDNAEVHIMNSKIEKIPGVIGVFNGGHMIFTNVTMKDCRAPEKHLDTLKHIWVTNGSKVTINAPCWFENNADLFLLEDSKLEINSNATSFDGDFSKVKDEAVIFTGNVYEAIIRTYRSDVRLSGIFYKNKTRLPIVTEYGSGYNASVVHFNGYIYVKENTTGESSNDYSDMGMFGNIRYIQQEDDFIDPNSEMDYYTFYWSAYFRCDPYECREYKILENLSAAEAEGLNANRDKDTNRMKTFTLKATGNGYTSESYRPIIDGINFNEETGRGYEVVYNIEDEKKTIHVNLYSDGEIKFKDMKGNFTTNTVASCDTDNPQAFIDWWNSLEFISTDPRYEYDYMYRRNPVWVSKQYPISLEQILRATADIQVKLESRRTEANAYDKYFVSYDLNLPKRKDGTNYPGAQYGPTGEFMIKAELQHDDNGDKLYTMEDWYEIKGIKFHAGAEDIYPFKFVGWKFVDGDKEYTFKEGEKYQFLKDFPANSTTDIGYYLVAQWEPKEVNVVYKLNKYVKYKGSSDEYLQTAKVGEYVDIMDIRNLEVDDRFIVTGWFMKEPTAPGFQWASLDATWSINGVDLPDGMFPNGKLALSEVGNRKLGSKIYIDEYKKDLFAYNNDIETIDEWKGEYKKDYEIFPIYYPKDSTVLEWVYKEAKALKEAAETAENDDYKSIKNSHYGYQSKFYYFFRNENTISGNVSIGEDVELAADITVTADTVIDLHGHRLVVTSGKFIIPEGVTLTINNCRGTGGFAFGDNSVVEGAGQLKLDSIYIHDIDNTIVFDNDNVYMSNVKMNDIMVNSGNLFEIKNDSKVKLEKMAFDGLKAGFNIDNSYLVLSGVSVKNSTVDVLFNVHNKAKVDVSKYSNKEKVDYVNSIFENNKNIALVDDSKFMVTGGEDIDEDSQRDKFLIDGNGNDTRNPWTIKDISKATVDDINRHQTFWNKLIDVLGKIVSNEINEKQLKRVLFRNNKGNYVFGAKNNAEIFFNGIAINNQLTADEDGKMGTYLNLGGQNKLVLRNTPYINQNSRNIVVTDDDFITCDTDEPEYQHGRTLSKNATLSFYITKHKITRLFVGTDKSWKVKDGENPFGSDNYIVSVDDSPQMNNYLQPYCMIEGYRDDLFNFYGEDYAGTKMSLVFREDEEDPTIKGFYAEPDETKDIIKIKLHANGGVLFSVDENGNPITDVVKDEEGNIIEVFSCVDEDGKIKVLQDETGKKKDRERYTPKIVEGYNVVTDYEFDYPRFKNDADYWHFFLTCITPVKIEKTDVDTYQGKFKGWLEVPIMNEKVLMYPSIGSLIDKPQDVDIYAYYYFPPLAKITYTIEKGGAESLRGIAYEVATESTVTEFVSKFRMEDLGLSADIEAPAFNVLTVTPINGWKMGAQWVAEDNESQPRITPGVGQRYTTINEDAHYYIEWIDPSKPQNPSAPVYTRPTSNNNNRRGGGGSSGGGGGGAAPLPNSPNGQTESKSILDILADLINNVVNPGQQAVAAVAADAQAAATSGPTAENPFAAKVELNALGEAVIQTNEQVGQEQFEKAVAVMQQAAAANMTESASVGQSIKTGEAKWERAADGSWSLSAGAEGVKNSWQPVTDENGKNTWYKFDAEGKMQTGWVVDGDKAYYLLESGQNEGSMVKGVSINIGGYTFSFDNNGALIDLGKGQ